MISIVTLHVYTRLLPIQGESKCVYNLLPALGYAAGTSPLPSPAMAAGDIPAQDVLTANVKALAKMYKERSLDARKGKQKAEVAKHISGTMLVCMIATTELHRARCS